MPTTREDIEGWLAEGTKRKATHTLIVCDTFDWSDYPVYVKAGEDARKIAAANDGPNMTKLMEVYNMSMDLEKQINQVRARNF